MTETMSLDSYPPEDRASINARRVATRAAECHDCGRGGVRVDNMSGEIIGPDAGVWARLPEGARALLPDDGDGRLRCDECHAAREEVSS